MRREGLLEAGRREADLLDEYGEERSDLHLAEAGQRADPALKVARIRRIGPEASCVAVVGIGHVCGKLLDALRHSAGEPVDCRWTFGGRIEVGRVDLRKLARVQRAETLEQ